MLGAQHFPAKPGINTCFSWWTIRTTELVQPNLIWFLKILFFFQNLLKKLHHIEKHNVDMGRIWNSPKGECRIVAADYENCVSKKRNVELHGYDWPTLTKEVVKRLKPKDERNIQMSLFFIRRILDSIHYVHWLQVVPQIISKRKDKTQRHWAFYCYNILFDWNSCYLPQLRYHILQLFLLIIFSTSKSSSPIQWIHPLHFRDFFIFCASSSFYFLFFHN